MKKTLPLIAGAALALAMNANATTYSWNFGATNATASTAFSSSSGSGAPGVTVGNFSIGNLLNGLSVGTTPNNTSPSNTYTTPTPSAGDNLGSSFKNGSLNTSTSGYFSLTITTSLSNPTLVLSDFDFGVRATGTGAQLLSLRSSADSFATDIFTVSATNNSTWAFKDNTFSSFSVNASSGIEFRLYGSGGLGNPANSTITTRIDDVKITVTAVPEPATYGIILGGAIGLFAFARARRRKAVLK